MYRGRSKKFDLPVFREDSYEEFLCLIQDFSNWITYYEFNQSINMSQVYDSFIDCLNGKARDSWMTSPNDHPRPKTLV